MAKKKSDSDKPAGAEGGAQKPYVVLARKYRPQSFDDLIGQEAMVKTLRNAFASGRIAQAYMLTGVRGVGKTTTARIIARALNYETDDVKAPTIDMPVLGTHCTEIMESRHPDVIEMDAASNTGVDNIRELIESARYKPIIARTKVFIIDEVHMLSKGAFNALLKTLEEPPEHVKFIFATTEIRKVPVTVSVAHAALRSAPRRRARAVGAFRQDRRQRGRHGRRRCAGADRPLRRRLGARWPVAARSGDRHGRGRGARRDGALDARPRRPRAHLRSHRARVPWRRQGRAALHGRAASRRRRTDPAAGRPRRSGSRRRARQSCRRRGWQRGPERRGTAPRRRPSPASCRRRCCRAPGRCC